MNWFTMSNMALKMSFKVNAKEVGKLVDKLDITPSGNLDIVTSESVNVAAVQLLCRRYATLSDYVSDMNLYVSDAVNRRAQLVCFPAFTGLLPLSFLPQVDAALEKVRFSEEGGSPPPEAVIGFLSYFSDFAFEAFTETMSALAAAHRVYIMAGSTLYYENRELQHQAFLYGEDGGLVGCQDKISLSPLEQSLGIEPAGEIRAFETPMGTLCIAIGNDVHYYEVGRIAKNMGATILLNPTAHIGDYTPVDAAMGLNLRVQENNLYGVQTVLAGDCGLGVILGGNCCVFAPNAVAKAKNGVMAKSTGRLEPEVMGVHLDMESLEQVHNPYFHDANPDLMEQYVDRLF